MRIVRVKAGGQTRHGVGNVIATGTPAGVGPLEPGDRVEARIEGIGL